VLFNKTVKYIISCYTFT